MEYDTDKKFCEKCGQKLNEPPKPLFLISKKVITYYEFKDGFYCERCAKIKIENERAKK